MGVDLTRNFYFSLSYNLAATLQHNFVAGELARLLVSGLEA
jgi:hypothetical protein